MAVIRQKYNPSAVPGWSPVKSVPQTARPAGLRKFLARLAHMLDGDPERVLLGLQLQKRIDKTRTDIYLDTGTHWF